MATIKDVIGIGPDELAKLDPAQLLARCEPFLAYKVLGGESVEEEDDDEDKQPELAGVVNLDDVGKRGGGSSGPKRRGRKKAKDKNDNWLKEAQRLAAQHGVVLPVGSELPKELKLK